MTTLVDAAAILQKFAGGSLRDRIAQLEKEYCGETVDREKVLGLALSSNLNVDLLTSALVMKQLVGQVNVIIHAVGILLLLPHLLQDGEIVESLSLGAGNTPNRRFDLETNLRVAEFKFVNWRGADSVRQKSTFKDYYRLAEAETTKDRYLYVIGDAHLLSFLSGKSLLKNVIDKRNRWAAFEAVYGDRFNTINEYYEYRQNLVKIVDITSYISDFAELFESQASDD